MSSDPVPDRGVAVFAVTTATLVLASVFVAARLVCRIGIVRNFSLDDYFIVLAWLIAFGLSFAIDLGTANGLGRHDQDIAPYDWNTLMRCEYVFSVLYNPALMATKTSILVFYLRLSKNTERVLRIASWATLVIVNVAGFVLTFINIFQCNPVKAAYNTYDGSAKCIPLLTEFICSAPINIVTDLAILALPLPVLTGMRLPIRQKIILVLTFTLGIFVTVVDVVRIYYLQRAVDQGDSTSDPEATFGDQPQFAWNASLCLMWSAVEVNVGVTCACIPTLKPLIIRILPAMIIDPDGTRRGSDSTTKQRSRHSAAFVNGGAQLLGSQSSPEASLTQPGQVHEPGDPSQTSGLDFITTPDMDMATFGATMNHAPTGHSSFGTSSGGAENSVYFGFVNMKKPKSMIRTSVHDSFKYCTIVTILFFVWGFSYGLLNSLNNAVAVVANMSMAETLGLTSIYFGAGYFFGPLLVGEWLLRHDEHRRVMKKRSGSQAVGGFKATFMAGLAIYGIGTIMFWPSAVLLSFTGFMICNFVVGFGLAVLETAANPFLAFCGPMDYAEMRLLLAQGVQAIATLLSQVLAQKVFFTNIHTGSSASSSSDNSQSLLEVQWTYLAITLFCAALALFFYYMPLPEVTDAEMGNSTRYLPVDPTRRSIGGFQLRTWTLTLAVLAQWTYVAGQETMSIFFEDLLTPSANSTAQGSGSPKRSLTSAQVTADTGLSNADYLLVAHAAFAISRFYTAYLAYLSPTCPRVPQPRTVLSIHTGLSIICAILIVVLRPYNYNYMAIPTILFYFFEGPLWPLIFALGLRGQGKRTKRASAFITMGASGPAFWPFVIYAIHQNGGSYQTAFSLVPALLVITGAFSLFLDIKRDARDLVDARVGPDQQRKIQDRANREMDLDTIMPSRQKSRSKDPRDEDRAGFVRRLSEALTWKGMGGSRRSSEQPRVDHREDKNGDSLG